jgi:tRNA uridine 5-carboxymethylaminomethyl modification enzyme
MGRATDRGGIQFRVLNARKGPAVRATRAQADRVLYKAAIREILENQPNLTIFQQSVEDLIVEDGRCKGAVTGLGLNFRAENVVLCTGTFLGGVIHVGLENSFGGRAGDAPANGLAAKLRELPFRVERLKTGTPPRVDGKTVDFSVMEEQWGDPKLPVMSYMGRADEHPRQTCCFIAQTNARTHEIVGSGMDRSPMFSGDIEGVGPRYCPSIEDKVHRYPDKDSHQIFVEPEGLNTHELYPNGISTSLPFDVQLELVRSIRGFENAHITRPGYAIEYDFFNPQDLQYSLETKYMPGLFFAGQINGTTGYEEAAAQGLIAGLNAARQARGQAPWTPGREEAYIGVLIDDLITMGTQEPYRMFTSRAEHRLLLREDNADLRLTEKGHELGLVSEARLRACNDKREGAELETERLKKTMVQPNSAEAETINAHIEKPLNRAYSLMELLKRPQLDYATLVEATGLDPAPPAVAEQAEIQAKYSGYIERQENEIAKLRESEDTPLPADFDYAAVQGLSNEVMQKLNEVRPETIGQASRIPGVTPAAISLLLIQLKKQGSDMKKARA